MSDISLDYSEQSDDSRSNSSTGSDSPGTSNQDDKPMWRSKRSSSRSSRSPSSSSASSRENVKVVKKKRSPIRAPSLSPKKEPLSPIRGRYVSPERRRRRSPRRSRSRGRRSPRRSISRDRRRSVSRNRRRRIRSRERRRSSSYERENRRRRSRSRSLSMDRRRRSPRVMRNRRRRSFSRSPSSEEDVWEKRRDHRYQLQDKGEPEVWGSSPSQKEIEEAYKLRQEFEEAQAEHEMIGERLKKDREKEKKKEEKKRKLEESESDDSSDSDSDEDRKKKKKKKSKKAKKSKKSKKEKKHKKEKKKKDVKKEADEESSDEWEERLVEPHRSPGREGSYSPGPIIPDHIKERNTVEERLFDTNISYGKDLLKGEGAGMAAYAARGERIPRRGEIGLSSDEIAQFEKWGYVMSGSRHKAMEATRLRKENQILTAEEKRLLSGVSMEAKKKKEEAVLNQFRNLIKSKNMKKE